MTARTLARLLAVAIVLAPISSQAAMIVFSGADGTAGTNEIEMMRPPAHPGAPTGSIGDLTDLTTDYGVGPLVLQLGLLDGDPARLTWGSGAFQTVDESNPAATLLHYAGGSGLTIDGAASDGAVPVASGALFAGTFTSGPMAITMATDEPCLYPNICTGTITGKIDSGTLDAALAAALGVSQNILGGTFTLLADNLVYDDATGEFEGVVTTKQIVLEVLEVPAPPALALLGVALIAHRVRRRRR
jgi:hypothetical protein